MSNRLRQHRVRKGLTLIELLVVITISVMLLGASVQLLRLPLQSRKTREAARQMSALVSQVKARATEIRRPVGLLFRRGNADVVGGAFQATEIQIVETPPYYTGDEPFIGSAGPSPGSAARIDSVQRDATGRVIRGEASIASASLLHPNAPLDVRGAQIQFGNKNPWYEIESVVVNGALLTLTFLPPVNASSNPPISGNWVPFSVAFQPGRTSVFPMLTAPVKLPTGIAIDLTLSGVGPSGVEFAPLTDVDGTDIVVMFSPQGHIDRLYFSRLGPGVPPFPMSTLFFLIGKVEQISPQEPFAYSPADRFRSNLMDPESIWIALGHKTGKITVAENINLIDELSTLSNLDGALAASRMFARSSSDMGGR